MTRSDLILSDVLFEQASEDLGATGLLGHVSFVVNDAIRFDHVAVRRTRASVLTLSYRAIDTASGDRRYPVRPTGEPARIAIEEQVFASLRQRGILP